MDSVNHSWYNRGQIGPTTKAYLYLYQKESSYAGGFTRVAAPSVVEYAQAMVKILQKMGWRRLAILVSTTHDGKIFSDAMNYLALKEKWIVTSTLRIAGEEGWNEISTVIQNVIQSKPDVIIGHIRQRSNDDIFWTIQNLQALKNGSVWLVSDVTTYGIRNLSSIPPGVLMVSAKSPEIGHDYELYINTLYDSFVLFESVFNKSITDLGKYERQSYSTLGKSKCLQINAMK